MRNVAPVLSLLMLVSSGFARPPQPDAGFELPLVGKAGARPERAALAAESSHSYDVRHYRIDLNLPMTNPGYSGRTRIAFRANLPLLDSLALDFDGLVCDSVQRDGVPLSFTTPAGQISVRLDAPLPAGDSTALDVFFRRESAAAERGYFFAAPPRISYAHAMTCGCPTDNHFWFPCYDLPSDKAERGVALNLTLPDTFQTCAVGLCDSVTDNGNGTRTWHWRHPYPIATYLVTFSASRFTSWDTSFVNTTGETIPVRHWMWPQDSAATRTGYRRLPEMIDYFIRPDIFGAYPFEKFGHVPGYYGFPWGGMEHQTLVMLHRTYIGGGAESTIAHELSHMWWGDMVTHVGYADVWLNEGFATYAECIGMGALNGRDFFRTFIAGKGRTYINRDKFMRMPLYDPPWHLIYDYGHIYCKGAWVQHTLRWVMGDTAWDTPGTFFAAQRAYGDSFRYGTASTEDYRRVCEQVSGLELGWFFDEWVHQAGYPKYHLDWQEVRAGDDFHVFTSLGQRNGAQAPDFFRTPLGIRIAGTEQDTLVVILPHANPQTDTFRVRFQPVSLTIDPDNWIIDSAYVTGVAEQRPVAPAPRIVSVRSNPARGPVRFTLAGPAGADCGLEILDRAGRRSARLAGRYGPDGRAVLDWRQRASAGVYFCRVAGGGEPFKLVLAE